MRLVANEKFHYNQQTRQKGEEFDAEEIHGKLFIQRGMARALKAEDAQAKPMTTQNTDALAPPLQATKRTYKRRDMRAED